MSPDSTDRYRYLWEGRDPLPDGVQERLQAFGEHWLGRHGNEQQLSQQFLLELCEALGTARPGAAADGEGDFCFEKRVDVPGTNERGRIDLYKRGHFVLESKCGRAPGEPGSAPFRNTKRWLHYIESAYRDQAQVYASLLPEGRPPLLIVVDVGWHIWIWRGFHNSPYGLFHSPDRLDLPLAELGSERNARILWSVFEEPSALDPSRFQARVTDEVAAALAPLAAALEEDHDSESVSRFLMRCLFCMFAEDVDLLPSGHFTKLLARSLARPDRFATECERLFEAMKNGGDYDWEDLKRFNGALFGDSSAIPLTRAQLGQLADAASMDWAWVEPAIFGTVVERALNPRERSKLGAHFTPRSFVERLVRPTLMEPLRQEWEAVLARVDELVGTEEEPDADSLKKADSLLHRFQGRLAGIRVLDPACGTGNFLYVAYRLLKELEHEVLETLHRIEGARAGQALLGLAGATVVPAQFLGIDVKPFSAEIAQLVLWIGHLQWELLNARNPVIQEPVIPTQRTIECRDALLAWDSTTERVDDSGAGVTRWDGETRIVHPTTGRLVPDPTAQLAVLDYHGLRRADWPEAEFIVGNPPFIGNKHMRERLGDGYVEALRKTYEDVGGSVDFVTYWWHRAAERTRVGGTRRFGFITTNSLKQVQNRACIAAHLESEEPLRLVFAIPDHPWTDKGADVRISMTAAESGAPGESWARMASVQEEDDGHANLVLREEDARRINADLSTGPDLGSAVPLVANKSVSFQGMNLVGKGFRLRPEDVDTLGFSVDALPPVIRPYMNAREMMQNPLGRYVIDAFGFTAEELRGAYPTVYQWLWDRVRPEREQNRDPKTRKCWWQFGRPREAMRPALEGLDRFLITAEASKHRVFRFEGAAFCPDHTLYAIALDGWSDLGILQSRAHVLWAKESGGRLGVGNDLRYNNTRCFLTYPFPPDRADDIGAVARALDHHRDGAASRGVTLTQMYNLVDAVREGRPLTASERDLHIRTATDELIRLHETLDGAVLRSYGWSDLPDDEELLGRLLETNHESARAEAEGTVRWLRPDRMSARRTAKTRVPPRRPQAPERLSWPADKTEQVGAILSVLVASAEPLSVDAVGARFLRARRARIAEVLGTLARRRLVLLTEDGRYRGAFGS